MTEDFAEVVPRLLEAHNCSGELRDPPRRGRVCHLFMTDRVVLKIPRRGFEATARIEGEAARKAGQVGMHTARCVALDMTHRIVARDYTIWDRLEGEHPGAGSPVWAEFARQLSILHRQPIFTRSCDRNDHKPSSHLTHPNVTALLNQLGATQKVTAWSYRLEQYKLSDDLLCSIHGDVHQYNVLISPADRLIALLDWGNAGVGDPAYDLARAPLEALPSMLTAYQEVSDRDLGPDVQGRILRYRLGRLLRWAAHKEEEPNALRSFLAFAENLPPAWRDYGP